ncbi:MAG: L-threonylcarbamoyladenylate synthase [Bryobacterales bacterium]|nr:L-threonylcarbamoyladenylate synthase [Bryobacterales bacterium]
MTTHLIETSAEDPDHAVVEAAVRAVRSGEVIAIPSDALYVLVADPLNLNAVAQVFEAKGREAHRSLPLLVDSVAMAVEYAGELPSSFYLLARRFWPGLLTLIVQASSKVPLRVTGNTGRLALRRPASALAKRLVAEFGTPLIATSANVSGKPTCRGGFEVLGTMDGRISLIVDGGIIEGPASTTIDITALQWRLIKQGGVATAEIDACLAE